MSYSKIANAAASMRARNIHYVVSTFAAVVYAVIWLLSSGARADSVMQSANAQLPEIVITAQRPSSSAVVEVAANELPEIVVWGARENVRGTAGNSPTIRANARSGGGWIVQARNWLADVLK